MNHVTEQCHHGTLISGACVLQSERHNLITESAPRCNESSLLHGLGSHFDLIVTGETIHEGENFMLSGVVNQNINMRKWKIIFRTRFVQISVIHTHSYLTILLRYGYHVCNPLRIRSNGYKTGVELLHNFGFDFLRHLRTHATNLLFHWEKTLFRRQLVYHNINV